MQSIHLPSSRALQLSSELIATLPVGLAGLFNPWAERCLFDAEGNGPEQRLERLAQHLDCSPRFVMFGEAPGYAGCRYTGVAFTSERLVMDGAIPRVSRAPGRLTTRQLRFSEPSATIVWDTLYQMGESFAEQVVLWNALQLHPFKPEKGPHSNREPEPGELVHGRASAILLRHAFPDAKIVAIGRKAELMLAQAGIVAEAAIRHPSNGGKPEFVEGMRRLAGK